MSAGRQPTQGLVPLLLVGSAVVALGVSYTLPTVTFRTITSREPEVYSIWGGIVSLWRDGNVVLAPIVFLFSIVFPIAKLVLLGAVITHARRSGAGRSGAGRAGAGRAGARRRYELVEWLRWLGKWSMLDVLIIALFVGSIRIGLATASSLVGIHVFCAAIFLSILASVALARQLREALGPGEGVATVEPCTPLARWIGRLVSLACCAGVFAALSQPLLVVSKALFFSNEVALGPMARTLATGGERGLGLLLLVFVVALPAVRAVLGLSLWWLPARSPRMARVARGLDEWAMLDVLALALAIVHVKLEELASTRILPGFWAVFIAGALCMWDAWLVRRRGQEAPPARRCAESERSA